MLREGDIVAERYQVQARVHDEPALSLCDGEDLRTGQPVLLAALRGETADPRLISQLRRLATTLRPTAHPHVAGIIALESVGPDRVVVYERPPGEFLSRILVPGPLPRHSTARIALHVAEALAFLHARDTVHGALAPGLVVVDAVAGTPQVCVIGAGLAAILPRMGIGNAGAVYAAPERRRGADPLPQSDVFSLGAVMAHMLTGDPPSGPAAELAPGETDPIRRAIRRAMAPRVEDRPADGKQLLALLQRDLAPITTRPRVPEPDRRPEPGQAIARRAAAAAAAPRPSSPPAAPVAREKPAASVTTPVRRAHPLVSLAFAFILPIVVFGYPYHLYRSWVSSAPADVVVPDVVGRTEAEARDIFHGRGLKLAIVDEVYDPDVPEGQVVWAGPPAGRTVKAGRQIRARISRGAPAVVVPDVTRQSREDAEKRLAEVGLGAAVSTQANSDIVAENAVISQIPRPGRKLREGADVQLMVSLGPSPESEEQAKARPSRREAELETKSARVTFDVPQGAPSQRVQIRVSDETAADQMAYDGLHEPGDHIDQRVEGHGETTVTVLIDDKVIKEQKL